jgi:hypothetical protein
VDRLWKESTLNLTRKTEIYCSRYIFIKIIVQVAFKSLVAIGREEIRRYEEGSSLHRDFAGVGISNISLSLRICHRAFQNLVIGEMVMETWKHCSVLAFWEYKD